jgi:hypothetical protein
MTCTQKSDCGHECGKPHHATFFWPGRDPSAVCWGHLQKARGIAEALGFSLVWTSTPEGDEYAAAMMSVHALGGKVLI